MGNTRHYWEAEKSKSKKLTSPRCQPNKRLKSEPTFAFANDALFCTESHICELHNATIALWEIHWNGNSYLWGETSLAMSYALSYMVVFFFIIDSWWIDFEKFCFCFMRIVIWWWLQKKFTYDLRDFSSGLIKVWW